MQNMKLNRLLVLVCLVLIFLASQGNSLVEEKIDFLVLKNAKISAISFKTQKNQQHLQNKNMMCFTLKNTVQSIVIETLATNLNTITKCMSDLPIFIEKISKKGYFKPITNDFSNKNKQAAIIGYKYLKPNDATETDQVILQVKHFLQSLIKSEDFQWLGIRLQDSFQLEIMKEYQKDSIFISRIQLKYLFATIQKNQIPENLLNRLQLIQYNKFRNMQQNGIIERKIAGSGFHQWVNFTVTLNQMLQVKIPEFDICYLEFYDILPQTTYVDADQRRKQTQSIEMINVELPQLVAKQYYYSYRVSFSEFVETGVHKYLYQQPIHFRYPIPSQNNYSRIYLHPIEKGQIVCQSKEQGTQQRAIFTYPLKQNSLFDRGMAKIPTGNSDHAKIVSILTFIVTLLSALVLTKQLRKID